MRKPIVSLLGTALLAIVATAANAQSTVHLYIYDTHTGMVTQATGPMERDPYNASFSNNGKKLVHDLTDVLTGAPQLLGVTDLSKGTTTSLGLIGDDAVWSPNGKTIAYHNWEEFFASGGDPNVPILLNVVPAAGGTPWPCVPGQDELVQQQPPTRILGVVRGIHRHRRPRWLRDALRLRCLRKLSGLWLQSGLLAGRQAHRL